MKLASILQPLFIQPPSHYNRQEYAYNVYSHKCDKNIIYLVVQLILISGNVADRLKSGIQIIIDMI